jgi:hypothetical protein
MTTATISIHRISFPSINWKLVCLFGFFMASALLIFYVYQVNYLTGGTYLISNYEKEANILSQESKNIEVSFAESGFLGEVLQKTQELGFQKTTAVKYIQVPDTSLALVK